MPTNRGGAEAWSNALHPRLEFPVLALLNHFIVDVRGPKATPKPPVWSGRIYPTTGVSRGTVTLIYKGLQRRLHTLVLSYSSFRTVYDPLS